MNETQSLLELMAWCGIAGMILGLLIGWFIRSLFIAREIERICRESWKQASTYARHGGEL